MRVHRTGHYFASPCQDTGYAGQNFIFVVDLSVHRVITRTKSLFSLVDYTTTQQMHAHWYTTPVSHKHFGFARSHADTLLVPLLDLAPHLRQLFNYLWQCDGAYVHVAWCAVRAFSNLSVVEVPWTAHSSHTLIKYDVHTNQGAEYNRTPSQQANSLQLATAASFKH